MRNRCRINRDNLICNNAHAKRLCAPRHLAPDAAEANQAECLAFQLCALQFLFGPLALLHRRICKRNLPRQGQHQCQRQLCYGGGGCQRRVNHDHITRHRGGHIHIVNAHTRTPHHAQMRCSRQQCSINFRAAAHHQRMVVADARQQLRSRDFRFNVHVRHSAQALDARRSNIIGNQHAQIRGCGHRSIYLQSNKTSGNWRGLYSHLPIRS